MESTLQKPAFVAAKTTPKLLHDRFFAGFTWSLAFRYSVIFIARLTKFQTTPRPRVLSSFQCLFFRDCGCGKAMSFDDFFRRDSA